MDSVPLTLRLTNFVAASLCRYRTFWPVKKIGQLSYLVWRAYENRDFNMATNGEQWLLARLSRGSCRCVMDVGANTGDWTKMCQAAMPGVFVHAFEIAPPVFSKLSATLAGQKNVKLNPIGLSDQAGTVSVFYPEADGYVTTAYPQMLEQIHGYEHMASVRELRVPVMTGDQYVVQNSIQTIDILKIDVEGMEQSVLRGFGETLNRKAIRLVQFEYNTTNIASRFLLRDAYDLFSKHGYQLGKLYPNYVEFRDYHYRHEDFCGPNMVAVRKDDHALLNLLSR